MTENVKRWIEEAHESQKHPEKAQVLPIVSIDGQYYFVDVRMKSVRNIDNLLDILDFDSQNDLIRYTLTHAKLVV
jgi:hypothetical protein